MDRALFLVESSLGSVEDQALEDQAPEIEEGCVMGIALAVRSCKKLLDLQTQGQEEVESEMEL
jgi:hypothetical protein